jgi:hypothetical protein
MTNPTLKIINAILAFQKKVLNWYYDFKYAKYTKKSSSKTYVTAGEMLYLNAQEKLDAKEVIENAKNIFKENLNEPEKIFDYIKSQGTPVIKLKKAQTLLWFAGQEEGFIPPQKNIKALILCLLINIFTNEKIESGFKTKGMFVFRDSTLSPYLLAYHLYHWMAYSKNLSGYDERTIRQFKNIFTLEHDIMARKSLSIEEILSLKEAIAREIEAIDMVVQLAKEVAGAKKASDKFKKDGNISI